MRISDILIRLDPATELINEVTGERCDAGSLRQRVTQDFQDYGHDHVGIHRLDDCGYRSDVVYRFHRARYAAGSS